MNTADIDKHLFLEPGTILAPPEGISCPEGMWIKEAWIRLGMKKYGAAWGRDKLWEAAWALKDILVQNPNIEVFTIDSRSGVKEAVDRDWLRGRNCTNILLVGYRNDIYRQDNYPEGKIIFIDRAQFEPYLTNDFNETDKAGKHISPRKRKTPFHEDIKSAVIKLTKLNNEFPSANQVLQELDKNKIEYPYYLKIEKNSKGEAVIWYKNANQSENTMKRKSFDDRVSIIKNQADL